MDATENRGREEDASPAADSRCALPSKLRVLLQSVEAIPNLDTSDDWRLNSESALVAAFSKRLALKLTYLVRYDHLPEPTFKDTDRLFTAGIQVTY